jgi:hypothetical protein
MPAFYIFLQKFLVYFSGGTVCVVPEPTTDYEAMG